ncbi:MAG: AAA family ATPase [Dehalococcoidia bacterium]
MSGLPPLVQDLLRPEAYPHRPQHIELAQTQMSFVFLTGELAYKVKKPVDLGYLDYTTLEKRHHFCHQEVALNRRLSPQVYLGVVGVTREDGRYFVEREGEAVEYAVKMRQLPRERMLDHLLRAGQATPAMLEKVGEIVARFHGEAATSSHISTFGSIAAITANAEENFSQTEAVVGLTIPRDRYQAIMDYTRSFLQEKAGLFQRRVAGGRIRDCHGDLHAAHICFEDGLHIYDCIEFNDRFRYGDVASEAAFLAMDLDFHGRPDLSRAFMSTYLETSGDGEMSELLPFYKGYRAYVRGKVEGFKLSDPHIPAPQKAAALTAARHYLDLAYLYTRGGLRPLLLITVGMVGTGKTSVAQALGERLGMAVFSSDPVRKELSGVPAGEHRFEPPGEGIYAADFDRRTYDELLRRAGEVLGRGGWAIIDASFRRREERERAQEMARRYGAAFGIVQVTCPETTVKQRLEHRLGEATPSDGRWEIYLEHKRDFDPITATPPTHHLTVDTSQPPEELCQQAARAVVDWAAANP